MVSSPIHSILCHGITISLQWLNPKKPLGRETIIATIRPSHTLTSKSSGQPNRIPSHKLITSFSRKLQVFKRSIQSPYMLHGRNKRSMVSLYAETKRFIQAEISFLLLWIWTKKPTPQPQTIQKADTKAKNTESAVVLFGTKAQKVAIKTVPAQKG